MNNLIWWGIVGLVAGWATGKLMSGSGYGAITDIVLGILGAIIGGYLMTALGFAAAGGLLYSILVAVAGACLLVWVSRLVRGRRIA
jgi:uncharacterized membrane protein YeaQ/YmgE (transglycosylase-associated protein family)